MWLSIFFNLDLNLMFQMDNVGTWRWGLEKTGIYTVTILRNAIDDVSSQNNSLPKTVWVKAAPNKINIFMWRLFQERLPTCSNLTKRGIIMISEFCPLCNDTFELESRVFLSCQITSPLLIDFCNWWGASISGPTSLHALHSWGLLWGWKGTSLPAFELLFMPCLGVFGSLGTRKSSQDRAIVRLISSGSLKV